MKLERIGYSGQIYTGTGIRSHAQHVVDTLQKLEGQYDFVACTGKSGMSVAFAALAMSKTHFDLITVRKGESSHGAEIEGLANGPRYIVVDDLTDTGSTLERIETKLDSAWHNCEVDGGEKPEMVGVILYTKSCYRDSKLYMRQDGTSIPIYYPA